DLHRAAELARAIQFDIDEITKPVPADTEIRPRRIRLRITAATEAEAEQARRLIEQLLATLNCQMQPARAGANPRYATAPRWMSYGDFELPAGRLRRRRAS
ncbi:hypothetical protein SE17_36675, partial [Kouleothrix aurantiaca]